MISKLLYFSHLLPIKLKWEQLAETTNEFPQVAKQQYTYYDIYYDWLQVSDSFLCKCYQEDYSGTHLDCNIHGLNWI